MPDKQDQKKKDGGRKDKKTHAMHAHERLAHHEDHVHNPAGDVPLVSSNSATHEHGLQSKTIHKEHLQAVDIHSDDKIERGMHATKAEKLEHDLKAEVAHAKK